MARAGSPSCFSNRIAASFHSAAAAGHRLFFQLARLRDQDVGQLGVAATRAQQLAESGQRGGVTRTVFQVGEQDLEAAGAALDDLAQARDVQAQRQTFIGPGGVVQLAPTQGEQIALACRLLRRACPAP